MARFLDRKQAGRKLAEKLLEYQDQPDVLVLGLPRGGVPVAYEVAQVLNALLDIMLVRKLGVPGHEELAMGAIASGRVRVLNEDVVRSLNISNKMIDKVAEREQRELERRERVYRGERDRPEIEGKTVILVDDGLATGASMRAAVDGVRARNPKRIVVAVPTAAPQTCDAFKKQADQVICAITPEPFYGVGLWYENFSQITDEQVRALLQKSELQEESWS